MNRRAALSWFCARHTDFPVERMHRATFEEIQAAGVTRRQVTTPTPYEVVALTLRNCALPADTARSVATEFVEAFRERDRNFNPDAFLRLALP